MAGAVDQQFNTEMAVRDKIEKRLQRMLYERQPRGRLEISRPLFLRGMRRVIGRDDVDASVI